MNGCYPAILLVPKSGGVDVPPASEAVAVATGALERAGWSHPSNTLIDAREGKMPIQDEAPPKDPVDVFSVALVFEQTEATFQYGYEGPFGEAMHALHAEYPDFHIRIGAVPGSGGEGCE